jgi:hypothetical protein
VGELTAEEVVAMMRAYGDGQTAVTVAADYGISVSTFHKLRKLMNVPTKRARKNYRVASVVSITKARKMLEGEREK